QHAFCAPLAGEQRTDLGGRAGRDFDQPLVADAKSRRLRWLIGRTRDHGHKSYRQSRAQSTMSAGGALVISIPFIRPPRGFQSPRSSTSSAAAARPSLPPPIE